MTIANGYCTLQEMKDYIVTSTTDVTDDAVIEDIVEGVSRDFDILTGRTFYARTETHYYDAPWNDRELWIRDDDLLTVTTLTNGDTAVIISTQYKLYPLNKNPKYSICLLPSSGVYWAPDTSGNFEAAITLVGTWGYSATAPDDIREACKREVNSRLKKRFGENTTGTATITGAGVVITPDGFSKETMITLKKYMRNV